MKKSTCSLLRTGQWTRQHVLLCNAQHITSTTKVVFLVKAKKTYRAITCTAPIIPNLGTSGQLHAPAALPWEKNHGTHYTEVCVSHTTGLDVLKKRKSLAPAANRIADPPARSVDTTNSANLVPTRKYLHTRWFKYDRD